MSKKDEKDEEVPMVEPSKKKEKKKSASKKRKDVRASKVESEEVILSTYYDLINNIQDDDLLNKLIESDCYNDYHKELRYRDLGYSIAPYVNIKEFYEKIGKK